MRRSRTIAATTVAFGLLIAGGMTPVSAAPTPGPLLLTTKEAASVYPGLAGGDRLTGRYGLTTPRFVVRDGKLKCDRYRNVKGVFRRDAFFFNVKVERSVDLDQSLLRLKSVKRAEALLDYYRHYIRKCRGLHDTDDGEGGYAQMRVRGWPTPRIGDDSVGMLDAFIQSGQTNWYRTVVVRKGRAVSVQVVAPYSGKGSAKQAIGISRKAIAKLR